MLRQLLGKRGGAALIAVAAVAATAAPAFADTPTEDQVSAGGVTGANSVMGGASRSGPSGEDAHGVWALANDRGLQSMTGHTTCLAVDGTTATIGIQIDSAEQSPFVGQYRLLWVGDNGSPGAGLDYIYGSAILATPPDCSTALPVASPRPIVFGDIAVTDAPPAS